MRKNLLSLAGFIILWYVAAFSNLINPLFLPTPGETLREGVRLIAAQTIFVDLVYSFSRILWGESLALLVGIPLGLLLGYYQKAYQYTEGGLDFFRSIPPVLTFPLALLIFGSGDGSRVAVIFFGCVTIVILNSALGVANSPVMRRNVAQIMGARWYQIFFRVVVFDALPQIFVGIRVSLSMAVIVGIVTEMLVGSNFGLGSRAVNAQISYNTPELFFIIIVVGMAGMMINKCLIMLENKVIHWKNAI